MKIDDEGIDMKIDGEAAKGYTAVRLDSGHSIEGKGTLTTADEETGSVHWKDTADQLKSVNLGPHMVRIVVRGGYRR